MITDKGGWMRGWMTVAAGVCVLLTGCSSPPAGPSPEELRATYCEDYAGEGEHGGRKWHNENMLYYNGLGAYAGQTKVPEETQILLVRLLSDTARFDCNDPEFAPVFELYVESRERNARSAAERAEFQWPW